MNLKQVKNIIKEFEKSTVHKLELSNDDFNIKLEKEPKTNNYINPSSDSMAQRAVTINPQVAALPQEEDTGYELVTAPLVGTFYNSPSPDSDPFVSLNKKVNKGDILCIVEAMKVMNELTAPISGEIVRLHVEDGEMVQYGDILMEIKPNV